MKVAVKHLVAVWFGAWLALCAGSTTAVAQLTGGSVTATAGAASPNPVASGQDPPAQSTLGAWATPPTVGGEGCTLNDPTWSWSLDAGAPAGVYISQPSNSSPAATLIAPFASPGTYTVSATVTATWTDSCGDSTSATSDTGPITFTVVGVQKIQYLQGENGYVDAVGTLYVLVGHSVTFQAVPNPNGSGWPAGWPVWSFPGGGFVTGPTVNVTFNTLSSSTSDYQTISVTCGNTSVTVNVIVYDLLPILTPQDNFDGRDLDNYGVCEYINLSFNTNPSGITESDIGGLEWQIDSGGGDLTDNGDGTGTYQCPDVAATVSLSLEITGGPMLGEKKPAPAKGIVPPDGAKVLQRPDTTLWHVQNNCSVGFCGDYYATCAKAVSFKQIVVREGECFSTATGFFKDRMLDGLGHEASANWFELKDLVKDKGYQFNLDGFTRKYDKIWINGGGEAYGVGTFAWAIPNEYKQKGAGDDTAKKYATANHEAESDGKGTCTISKAGSGNFSKNPSDASNTPANWNDSGD